jgi:flagellar protein FliS
MDGVALNSEVGANVEERVQIVTMLYDGSMKFIDKAREKMGAGDELGRTHYIKKASSIVKELSSSLNMEGGEIAYNLKNLYEFVLESLIKAEMNNSMDALDDAEKVLEILRGSWKELKEAKLYNSAEM